jgi:glycosyltransferase involved in cell wall biosynthesis
MVSVIIPVYNRYHLLREAVNSVLSQTYQDIELIVVDDGSEDRARHLEDEFSDIRVLHLVHTGMPGFVRNRGVDIARGQWIAFLDSDDIWMREKLAVQMAAVSNQPGCVINHTRERWVRDGRLISQKHFNHTRSGDMFEDSLNKCIIGPSTVLMRQDLFTRLGGFRDDLEIAEDYEFWLRVTALHTVTYCDSELVIKQAGHGDQLSEKYGQIEIFRIRGLEELVAASWFERHAGLIHQLKACRELSRKCGVYSTGARKRGKAEEARLYEELQQKYLSAAEALEARLR